MDKRPPEGDIAVDDEAGNLAAQAPVQSHSERDGTRGPPRLDMASQCGKVLSNANGEVTEVLKGIDLKIEAGSFTLFAARAGPERPRSCAFSGRRTAV